ncbi:beta-lactamase-like protein [Leptodontidium sp. 2 PMI_412]|nr:beta-lactamase-like protein [Leptodontidium sp. MPI-SDFR-AT-0119]KAH9216070.1 beta-lactamase-like protein [Leptodontidium sp. 2 PMI_412]
MAPQPLQTHIHSSSEKGLSSVTTLIVGSKSAILIDPPFLIPDANSVVEWIKKTTSLPLHAVFVTHHHPDHYFSANPILAANPTAKFYAAPYVRAGIDREYDEKVKFWPTVYGKENVPDTPRKPDPYNYSFILLEGNESSPIMLLGPVQGDSVDHTLFWLPTEKTIVMGDAMYGRSTHLWAEEIETPQILHAWQNVLTLVESLAPTKIIVGHLDRGWTLDAAADLAHNKKYLALFQEKIQNAEKKPQVKEIYETFKDAFPEADKNLDFFLGHLSNQFGEGGEVWEENRHHEVGKRTREGLEGFVL